MQASTNYVLDDFHRAPSPPRSPSPGGELTVLEGGGQYAIVESVLDVRCTYDKGGKFHEATLPAWTVKGR